MCKFLGTSSFPNKAFLFFSCLLFLPVRTIPADSINCSCLRPLLAFGFRPASVTVGGIFTKQTAVMSLSANIVNSIIRLPIVLSEDCCWKQQKNVGFKPVGQKPLHLQFHPFERKRNITNAFRVKHVSVICAAALNATCAAEQTQTVTRQSSTITVAPIQGKEKSPELDDGGAGLPPRDDGDGGGGGGGGGGHWSGGFFFFGFLAFLGLLKDQESEGPYRDKRRR